MKQNARNLLPRTVIKNSIGELGTLISLRHDVNGDLCWLIDWAGRGLSYELVSEVQKHEIA